jgi:hypothetical protein
MSTPSQHKLVTDVDSALGAKFSAANLGAAPGVPELVTFVGFVSGLVTQPGGSGNWVLMYLDGQLRNWLLVEGEGIVHNDTINDDGAPNAKRDKLWVRPDAAVGVGRGPQSDAARFLTGEFTRAGDFEAAPGGGTRGPSTGAFCGANTPLCCTRRSP